MPGIGLILAGLFWSGLGIVLKLNDYGSANIVDKFLFGVLIVMGVLLVLGGIYILIPWQ